MGDVDDELDQQHGQGAGELEGPEVPEHDDDGQGDLAEHGRTVDGLLQQAQAAGLGNTPQARSLKHIRRALRNTRAQVEAAEARGRARALEEFSSSNGEAVDAIRAQVRADMQAETARERSLARLGIAPDSPVRGLFDGVSGDHKAFERQADLLRAAGVSWDADPMVQQIARQRVSAWQEQAAQQNGHGVSLDPAGPVPEQVRDHVIRQQVEAMAAGQAGGQPPHAPDLATEVRKMADNPGAYTQEQILSVAERFNRDLDAISRQAAGGPL
jgi:exonuclease VII large subunit